MRRAALVRISVLPAWSSGAAATAPLDRRSISTSNRFTRYLPTLSGCGRGIAGAGARTRRRPESLPGRGAGLRPGPPQPDALLPTRVSIDRPAVARPSSAGRSGTAGPDRDRKSVEEGTVVSVRVDPGGRR